ncbi:hypothetical protein KBD59_03020, partial [Candidatus Gracilibacteria bacterium]|nr:hypothetical protein [Candidatus Gracilibacteria bacterium]
MSSQIINSFWIPLLIVMGVGLFVVGLVILGRRMQEQHLQRLQEIAQTLGLHFFPAEQIPSEFVEIIQTMQHKERYWKPYFFMEGRYNSVRAIVFSASRQQGRSRTFRTYILGFFSEPFKRELFVTKGNFLLDIAGRLTGKADFKTGDEAIDKKYFINAENGDEVIPFL